MLPCFVALKYEILTQDNKYKIPITKQSKNDVIFNVVFNDKEPNDKEPNDKETVHHPFSNEMT